MRYAAGLLALAGLALLAACGNASGTPYNRDGSKAPANGAIFQVSDTAGFPVVGATVYLVPVTAVDEGAIDAQAVLDGSAEQRDEPLEDAIRVAGATFPHAVTDASGEALFASVPDGRYFRLVLPAAADTEHVAGGNDCRVGLASTTFIGRTVDVTVSSQPPAGTTYLGSSACLGCHPGYSSIKGHAHRLGLATPGHLAALQDDSDYPGFQDAWSRFLPGPTYVSGTTVWFYDYDGSRGADKFKTSLSAPGGGATVYAKAWLWRDTGAGGAFKITLENVINPLDPRSPWTLPVDLTYGGALYIQLNLVAVPGRKGHYPLLQWQAEGDENSIDRTRKVYRDYHLDRFWDPVGLLFQLPPPSTTFEGSCAGCHFNGFVRTQDAGTGEWLADAVDDSGGAFDVDGDGTLDEVNVGCESCHGPGFAHGAWAFNAANAGHQARYIVTPQYLGPSRSLLLCGRCHDRPLGASAHTTEEPLDVNNRFPPPGISRADYLASYVSRKGPPLENFWTQGLYSKQYQQEYSDFLKSPMHRNERVLSTCADCHDNHGGGAFDHQLKYDPDDNQSLLCFNCHMVIDVGAHTQSQTGFDHGFLSPSCVACHLPQTARRGAGRYGHIVNNPPSGPADAYFENDVESHLFVVPRRTNPSVAGVVPADAMPIPFTNSCGFCHNVGSLYPKPAPAGPSGSR